MIKALGLTLFMLASLNQGMAATAQPASALLRELIAAKESEAHGVLKRDSVALTPQDGQSHQATFFKTHDVLFLFSSSCPHCHNQAPILKQWANDVGARVFAFTFDGQALPGFEDALPVPSTLVVAAFEGQPIRYPALFVMNKKTRMLYPIAIGELGFEELVNRMKTLLPKIIDFEGASLS